MDEDLPVEGMKVKDESEYQRDGTTRRVRVYAFYLGKHGPFVERVPIEGLDERAIHDIVDKLRRGLRALPT